MDCRVITRLLPFAVIWIIAAMLILGCGRVSTGPKYDHTLMTDPKLTPDARQTEWQKCKKWRSVHAEWIESPPAPSPGKPVAGGPPRQIQIPPSRILTLSQQQLLSLDWHSPNRTGARVKDKRALADRGVEFDIYFPSNSPGSHSLDFVSSGEGGTGTLVGADIHSYETFALKLTLVSIKGQSDPGLKQKLVAGAVIGPTATGQLCSYQPVTLSLAASEKMAIAKTSVSARKIYQIGFHVHMLDPQDWDSSGSVVTLRIEPVEDGRAKHTGPMPNR